MRELSDKLLQALKKIKESDRRRVFLGFDAFIDLIVRPIEKGNSAAIEKHFGNMESFGQYLVSKAGLNSSIELDLVRRKMGGNTPNVACSLNHLGIACDCLAPFGTNAVDEIFSQLQESGRLISTGDPGLSIALEFLNGKVMLGLNQDVSNLDWERIKKTVKLPQLVQLVEQADMLCLLNWSEMPKATEIFLGIKDEVLPCLTGKRPILIDLSDCSRRSDAELLEILDIIGALADSGKIIFGLNQNESQIVCKVLGIDTKKPDDEKAEELRRRLNLHWIVFHNRLRSILAAEEGVYSFKTKMNGPAVLQTGAGDHFNAGLCLGFLNRFDPALCLALAAMNAGCYVEKGKSADLGELIRYIETMGEV